jgi:hypothetical protein
MLCDNRWDLLSQAGPSLGSVKKGGRREGGKEINEEGRSSLVKTLERGGVWIAQNSFKVLS